MNIPKMVQVYHDQRASKAIHMCDVTHTNTTVKRVLQPRAVTSMLS